MKSGYSFWIGLWKSVCNNLVIFVPAILAFLANVPPKYTPIASLLTYIIVNFLKYQKRA